MMIAVAILAVLLGATVEGIRLKRLSDRYRQEAMLVRRNLSHLGRMMRADERAGRTHRVEWLRAFQERYAQRLSIYEKAARYPWLPGPPDWPNPK